MKKFSILYILICFCSGVNAQINFVKLYGAPNKQVSFTSIYEDHKNSFHITGSIFDSLTDWRGYYIKIDREGIELTNKIFGYWDQLEQSIEYNNTIYTVGYGASPVTLTIDNSKLFKFDQNGNNTLDTFYDVKSGEGRLYTMGICFNKKEHKILMRGTAYTGHNKPSRVSVICLDTLGNKLWYKYYGDSISLSGTKIYWNEPTNTYSIISHVIVSGNYYFTLINIDSIGNVLYHKRLNYNNARWAGYADIKKLRDGRFLLLHFQYYLQQNARDTLFAVYYSSEGDSLYAKKMLNRSVTYVPMNECADGGFITHKSDKLVPERIVIAKLDSNFNEVWMNRIDIPSFEIDQKVFETKDGGFAFAGNYFVGNENKIILVKTDAYGKVGVDELKNNLSKEIEIYPNPANSEINIQIKNPNHSYILYNQLGVQILHSYTNPITTSGFPSGMYFLVIQDKSGNKIQGSKVMVAH